MLIDPHALKWWIPPKGALRWVEWSNNLFLEKDDSAKAHDREWSYFPAENPILFHHFAVTEPTREGIIAFAQKFGLLGTSEWDVSERPIDINTNAEMRLDEILEITLATRGMVWELFKNWETEIEEIRVAYALWRALRKDDEAALHATFSLKRNWSFSPAILQDPIWRGSQHFGIRNGAWHEISYITTLAFERYSRTIRPKFDFFDMAQQTGLSVKFAPRSLIMLIWLQFAQAASASDRWKICDHCGEPFKPESMKARYCSDSHRQMAYLKRKETGK